MFVLSVYLYTYTISIAEFWHDSKDKSLFDSRYFQSLYSAPEGKVGWSTSEIDSSKTDVWSKIVSFIYQSIHH